MRYSTKIGKLNGGNGLQMHVHSETDQVFCYASSKAENKTSENEIAVSPSRKGMGKMNQQITRTFVCCF